MLFFSLTAVIAAHQTYGNSPPPHLSPHLQHETISNELFDQSFPLKMTTLQQFLGSVGVFLQIGSSSSSRHDPWCSTHCWPRPYILLFAINPNLRFLQFHIFFNWSLLNKMCICFFISSPSFINKLDNELVITSAQTHMKSKFPELF